MRFLVTLAFSAFLATASANTPGPSQELEAYVKAFSAVDGPTIHSDKLLQLVRKLRDKQDKTGNSTAFVSYLFDKTRQQFLRHYTEYATFSETLNQGTYNCLTGTSLYAVLLEHFNVTYQVIETNYHIFLVAETTNGRILLEATDGESGIVSGDANIEALIATYRRGLPASSDRTKTYYRYDSNLYKQVTLEELTGLLYYNCAIVAYNQHDLSGALKNLMLSAQRYQSSRTAEFAAILQVTVAESNMRADVKQQYLRDIQRLRASAASLSARGD